jgi:hypothetical protein
VAAVGEASTVIVNNTGKPAQPFEIGVTVIVAITDVDPLFKAVNDPMLPIPLAAKPIAGVLFVHV